MAVSTAYIRVWNAKGKHCRTFLQHGLKCLMASAMLQFLLRNSGVNREICLLSILRNEMGLRSIALYLNASKFTPKARPGSHSQGKMKQSAILGVTWIALDVASVSPHQLNNWCGIDNGVVVAERIASPSALQNLTKLSTLWILFTTTLRWIFAWTVLYFNTISLQSTPWRSARIPFG